LLDPTPTLSVLIYNYATSPFPTQQKLAWVAALVLALAALAVNSLVHWVIYWQIDANTTWKVILKALLSKAFKITHFSVLARRNGGYIMSG